MLVIHVDAEQVKINCLSDFISFAKTLTGAPQDVILTTDLDFLDVDPFPIIGISSEGVFVPFSGEFDGHQKCTSPLWQCWSFL